MMIKIVLIEQEVNDLLQAIEIAWQGCDDARWDAFALRLEKLRKRLKEHSHTYGTAR